MAKLPYRDYPKLRTYYKDHVWEPYKGPDFNTWVRSEFNCRVWLAPYQSTHDEWCLEFSDDNDATAFVLKWG